MFEVVKYEPSMKKKWDEFVMGESINGTFLQTKNFLDYHPEGRFEDCSLLIRNKGNIIAVIPGCVEYNDGKKLFISHKGSTFGGILPNRNSMNTTTLADIINCFEQHLMAQNFNHIKLKLTSDLFSGMKQDLIEYMLFMNRYKEYKELATYIDLKHTSQDILSDFHYDKRSRVKKMLGKNIFLKKLEKDSEISVFYQHLEENLKKYDTVPIHTLDEILDFKNNRLQNFVDFFGVFYEGRQVASSMMFKFKQGTVIHSQNLSCNYLERISGIDQMIFLYYSLIKYYREQGASALSWGISTENCGAQLNLGLIKSKESYGSSYALNKTFYKELG